MGKFEKYKKIDKDSYGSINDFLKERSLLTTREWMFSEIAIGFRREGDGAVPMTEVGQNLPEIFPFMDEEYSASEVSNAKNSFEKKVERAGVTFLYSIKKGSINDEKLEQILTNIATSIREIREVLDEEPSEEVLEELPSELKQIVEEINKIESGEKLEIESALFGEFIRGELGEEWIEKIDSTEFGELSVRLVFDRPLSKDDILVPKNLGEGETSLDLEKEYGFRNNGSYIERYNLEILD